MDGPQRYWWGRQAPSASLHFSGPCIGTKSAIHHCHDVVVVSATSDFCQLETFSANCSLGSAVRSPEVAVVRAARYGRMRLGRCVRRDYGHVGCTADVRPVGGPPWVVRRTARGRRHVLGPAGRLSVPGVTSQPPSAVPRRSHALPTDRLRLRARYDVIRISFASPVSRWRRR